jgi:hypothetical protein
MALGEERLPVSKNPIPGEAVPNTYTGKVVASATEGRERNTNAEDHRHRRLRADLWHCPIVRLSNAS